MKWKVTLYNSGSNFDEIVHARQMSRQSITFKESKFDIY